MTCPICEVRPGAHSFSFREGGSDLPTFYTCPAEATEYWDRHAIVEHICTTWARHTSPPRWIWNFNAKGFGLHHAAEIGVALDIVSLFESGKVGTIDSIVVDNANGYLRTLVAFLKPFMSSSLIQRVKMTQ